MYHSLSWAYLYIYCCNYCYYYYQHRRSQDFIWEVHFFPKKVDDLFLVVALKIASKYTSNLSHPA